MVVNSGNVPVVQKIGTTRGVKDMLSFTLQDNGPLITLQSIMKYCHDAPERVKV